jgi:hypothetical protein
MKAEFVGGPADGTVVDLPAAVALDGFIQLVEAPFKIDGVRATYAIYRLTECPDDHWRVVHVGVTDTRSVFVEIASQCTACSFESLAVMPQGTEFPLECAKCHRMTVWPAKATGIGA